MDYPKRLIEVDLPIRRISAQARREKSIRHGHISTLHIWWARRPLAACRAVIAASLWPDPADANCPEAFRDVARHWMKKWVTDHIGKLSSESQSRFISFQKNPGKLSDNLELRAALLDFIADFSDWDNSSVREYLDTARALTQAAHIALGGTPGTHPLVVDPFAGGGAIPLEALRVGADAFASDLNPVPILLNKTVLESIPKYGERLTDEVRKRGEALKKAAAVDLDRYYPKDEDGATPIAYLWARTIECEGPSCGVEVPLVRSLWLAKKSTNPVVLQLIPRAKPKGVDFQIIVKRRDHWVDQNDETTRVKAPRFDGTLKRGSVTCPCCGFTTPVARVRVQLKARHGGALDARLFCVVTTREGVQGRYYRLPTARDISAVTKASAELARRSKEHKGPFPLVPNEPLPLMSGVFNVPIYGHDSWGTLFTARQALALTTLARFVSEDIEKSAKESDAEFARAVKTCLALVVDREANALTALSRWHLSGEKIEGVFSRQALGMVWDFAEANPLSGATGDLNGALEWVLKVCSAVSSAQLRPGHVELASATRHPLPDGSVKAFVTDPPYYNAVPYADLSDFFYVWLKRMLSKDYPSLFSGSLSPKDEEACEMAGWDPDRYAHKDSAWFEGQMKKAMAEGQRILSADGIGIVVFAHKSTAGWEAQLQAMVDAGWIVTGSWPIDTEMGSRLRAKDSAALASSVHLVCRSRASLTQGQGTTTVGDWRDILEELPRRIHDWMPRLAAEGVVGADAIFACLGPALEIYSRHSRVEKASGEVVRLGEYLEHVWSAVAKEALDMVFQGADTAGFEPDARLTAMWLWTLSAAGNGEVSPDESGLEDESETGPKAAPGFALEYDAARKIAQGLGANLDVLGNLLEVSGDQARLLSVAERASHLIGKDDPNQTIHSGKRSQRDQLEFFKSAQIADESPLATGKKTVKFGQTVLDRVHQAMLLFGAGRSEALKRFLVDDGIGGDVGFWRLAQALSALYPSGTDEKRWVDGMLARKKGLGF